MNHFAAISLLLLASFGWRLEYKLFTGFLSGSVKYGRAVAVLLLSIAAYLMSDGATASNWYILLAGSAFIFATGFLWPLTTLVWIVRGFKSSTLKYGKPLAVFSFVAGLLVLTRLAGF